LAPPVPTEDDAFLFAVYGDRTGGPAEGIAVLKQAVWDTNRFDPDLVMTVGDLIQGYNTRPEWLSQMTEYRTVMEALDCPWFPVAGNHDIYWRGPGRPAEEHEVDYESFFGPLWYAFDHKGCRFIVLYTDEGDPSTGVRSFSQPDSQRMSAAQRAWLSETLASASDKRHVFVFCHHPRWRGGGYGDDWESVHQMLKDAGNVSAVFAGHVHRMEHDGSRDGIEYLTLATVGGHIPANAAPTGHLHHVSYVMVRDDGIAMATVGVGDVVDPRAMTVSHRDMVEALMSSAPAFKAEVGVDADGAVEARIPVVVSNPSDVPVTWTMAVEDGDGRWRVRPDHAHERLEPGARVTIPFELTHPGPLDAAWRPPSLVSRAVFRDSAGGWDVPGIDRPLKVTPESLTPGVGDGFLRLGGGGDAAIVESAAIGLDADSSLTLEGRIRPDSAGQDAGVIAKTEQSEYGLFLEEGRPVFYVFLGDGYVRAASPRPVPAGAWTHVAGVYDTDAGEVRLIVDGAQVAVEPGTGTRRLNDLPLIIGGDVGGDGKPSRTFSGDLDEIRLSRGLGPGRAPATAAASDTLLLMEFNEPRGPFVVDSSSAGAHGVLAGGASITPSK